MEHKGPGRPAWPKRIDDVDGFQLMQYVAADAMRVDGAKHRMLDEIPFDQLTDDQHRIHALSVDVVRNAGAFVTAMQHLWHADRDRWKEVARQHWLDTEGDTVVEDLWMLLECAGFNVGVLRLPGERERGD